MCGLSEYRWVIGTREEYCWGGESRRFYVSHGDERLTVSLGGAVLYGEEPDMGSYDLRVWRSFKVKLEVLDGD